MKQKVGIYFWVRVIVMCAALVAVITIMFRLNSPPSSELNICPTRVSSVAVIGSMALMQDGMTWYRAKGGQREELEPVAVEKWFGLHCKVDIEAVSGPAPKETHPWVTLAYVSGVPKTVQRAEDIYMWDGRYFRSTELTQAMTELESLPSAKKPGQN